MFRMRLLILIVLLLAPALVPAVARKKAARKERIAKMIAARRYVFQARFIRPMSGPQRTLTGNDYVVSVTPDSVQCYLPYIGAANLPPEDRAEGGLKFTSTKFTYTQVPRKKGIMEITIKPADIRDIQQMVFSIAPDGNALLEVRRITAQPAGYAGELN